MASAQDLIDICEEVFDEYKDDCNRFVKAVARKLEILVSGNANAITETIQGSGWLQLADGAEAAAKAMEGHFVVGGLKGSDQDNPSKHGHVVVVVGGELAHGKYPKAYWGRCGSTGSKNKGVNWAWRKADRDKIVYASMPTS